MEVHIAGQGQVAQGQALQAEAAAKALDRYGLGAGASRLITGNREGTGRSDDHREGEHLDD